MTNQAIRRQRAKLRSERREDLAFSAQPRPLSDPMVADYFGSSNRAGQVVNQDSAMTLGSVFAAVSIRAHVRAMLPFNVYSTVGGQQTINESHPVYKLLRYAPSKMMTAFHFWSMMEIYRLLWGNAYAEIEWDMGGNARGLHLIEPWRCSPYIDNVGNLRYCVNGRMPGILPEDVIHLKHMSTNGHVGKSVISWARETMGLALGAKSYGAGFFAGGGKPSGVLEHPASLKTEARKNIRKEWAESLNDPTGNRVAMLWEGMKYTPITIPPEDAQFIETSGMGVVDVARFMQVPPHLLYHFDGQPYNSLEQLGGEFLTYSLAPDLVATEQEVDQKLLNPPKLFSKYDVSGINKGDTAAQAAEDRELFSIGARNINEIKKRRGENGIGPDGDQYFVNAATIPLKRALTIQDPVKLPPSGDNTPKPNDGQEQGDKPAETPTEKPKPANPVKKAALAVASDAMSRLIRKEVKAAEKASRRPNEFQGWIESFYCEHEQQISATMAPHVALLAAVDGVELDGVAQANLLAKAHCMRSRQDLLKASEVLPELFTASVEACCSTWESQRSALLLGV